MADTLPEPAPAIRVSSPVNEEVRLGRRPDAEAATVFEIPAVDAAALASSLQRKHESHSKMEAALTTGQLAAAKPRARAPEAPGIPANSRASRKAAQPDQDRPTELNLAAVTDDALAATPAPRAATGPRPPAHKPVPAAAPQPHAPATAAQDPAGTKKFSETAWFMAAVTPDQLLDGEGAAFDDADAEAMTGRYAADSAVPEEVRRRFSLGADDKGRKKKK